MNQGTIAVALSGGVDSAAAAIILLSRGQSPVGLYLRLDDRADSQARACQVARELDIPLQVVDAREQFQACVIGPFIQSYAGGTTPNPCVLCNRRIKFGLLLDAATDMGCEQLATGHYARTAQQPSSKRWLLLRGVDRDKDQSYVLHGLRQEALSRARFVLGDLTKARARQLVKQRGIDSVAPESQDVCFGSGQYWRMIELDARFCPRPGAIVHATTGQVLGQHHGIHRFTIGQRRGLGISSRSPLYVVAIRPESAEVVVGEREQAMVHEVVVEGASFIPWLEPPPEFLATVQHRYRSAETEARIRVLGPGANGWHLAVAFSRPQFAPTPGQSLVMYRGQVVLGGGVITRTH